MNAQVEALRQSAAAHRAGQRMVEADRDIARAAALDPADRLSAFLHAQSRYELGFPAADLFARARTLWPDNRDALRNHALALASEGEMQQAEALLAAALRSEPGWLDGHRVLAGLRWTAGDGESFDTSYAEAVRTEPGNGGLWLGWFAALAQTRDWSRARAILAEAAKALGETRALKLAQAFVASESGDDAAARALFAALAGDGDDMLALARVRFHLRHGEPEAAQAIALPLLARPVAGQVWPYLSAIWRLLGDPRAVWLDGDPVFAAVLDVGLGGEELGELAALLRTLHTARRPYVEQSVRGGTQTDRSVLLRHEPVLQRTRAALLDAVHAFVAALPPADPRHPLLSRPRDNLLIAGSWSVRLEGQGYNVAHCHPMGWLSSAFYVATPAPDELGLPPAGCLRLGSPPEELGLGLAPYREIAPEPGKLALFASTMWHSTVPFARGERLNIAFDVVPAAHHQNA